MTMFQVDFVDFIPTDHSTGARVDEPSGYQIDQVGWSIELDVGDVPISLPKFIPTADSFRSVAAEIEDEDTSFLEASRQRLARQLRSDS